MTDLGERGGRRDFSGVLRLRGAVSGRWVTMDWLARTEQCPGTILAAALAAASTENRMVNHVRCSGTASFVRKLFRAMSFFAFRWRQEK